MQEFIFMKKPKPTLVNLTVCPDALQLTRTFWKILAKTWLVFILWAGTPFYLVGYSVLRQIAIKVHLYENESESKVAVDGLIQNPI